MPESKDVIPTSPPSISRLVAANSTVLARNPSRHLLADQHCSTRRNIVQYIEMEYKSNRLHPALGCVSPKEQQMAVDA